MSQPHVGEIRLVGFNFAPAGWARCDGSLLPISENEVLFQLIGTTYGGDGQETFALPDLRGRVPIHVGTRPGGNNYVQGESSGTETVTLTVQQMPSHTHTPSTAAERTSSRPTAGNAAAPGGSYGPVTGVAQPALGPTGGSQPHWRPEPRASAPTRRA